MKLEEQILLELKIELEELITEREGYIADNRQREVRGESMAYVEEDFDRIGTKMRGLREGLIAIGER